MSGSNITEVITEPITSSVSCRRIVSTSGSSGIREHFNKKKNDPEGFEVVQLVGELLRVMVGEPSWAWKSIRSSGNTNNWKTSMDNQSTFGCLYPITLWRSAQTFRFFNDLPQVCVALEVRFWQNRHQEAA